MTAGGDERPPPPEAPRATTASTGAETVSTPSLHAQAVHGVLWSVVQRWLVRLSTIVAFVLLGRLLTPAEFGLVALAMVVVTVLTVVTDAGFSAWLVQHRSLDRLATSTAFWISLSLGVVLAVLLAASAGPLAALFGEPGLTPVLQVLSLALVLGGLSSVPAALLQRDMRFKELAVRQVLATFLSVVAAVTLALLGAGAWALVAQTLVRLTVSTIALWATTDFRPTLGFSTREARDALRFGSRSIGATLGHAFREQGESFVIGIVLGTVALGYWTIAARVVNVVVDLCAAAMGAVAFSLFARLQSDPTRLTTAYARSMSAQAVVLAPVMVAMSLVSHDLVPLVFGARWEESAVVAAVLAVGMLFTGLAGLHRGVLLATGRAGHELWLTAVTLGGQVLLIVLLAPDGLVAVAVGMSAWGVAQFLLRSVVVSQVLRIGRRAYAQTAAVLLASGLAAAAVLGIGALTVTSGVWWLVLVPTVGALVYVPCTWLLARPTWRELVRSVEVARSGARRRAAVDEPEQAS